MVHEVSLPYSQEPATGPYPEPDESSPHPPTVSYRCILILPLHLRQAIPSGLLRSSFPTKILCAFLISPCTAMLHVSQYYRYSKGNEWKPTARWEWVEVHITDIRHTLHCCKHNFWGEPDWPSPSDFPSCIDYTHTAQKNICLLTWTVKSIQTSSSWNLLPVLK
jgi:hypothetical protein